MAKFFITKYALSDGIFEGEFVKSGSMIFGKYKDPPFHVYFHKGEFFDSKDEAIQNCEEKRKRKIKSLQKQIKKLEKLKFN